MPDFNKGDFTQQGVAGHVNANLRLNEKRLVNIDLTSNEEAEGCTITGTVKDLLNDKVYAIGSGVSGNIEITENGENINVAPYATATVNVAGGGVDLLHTELTIQNENSADFTFVAPEDTLLCAGYAVGTEALGSPINFLLTEIIDENDTLGIDFVTKNITIPGNSEVTFMLYYLSPTANCYINPSLNVKSVDNMELDDGTYYLINNASNSSIILSVRK